MKSLAEVKARVEHDIADEVESWMVAMCSGIHPLMLFVPDYYKDEAKDKVPQLTEENIIKEMQEYIDFAFQKAHDKRGISANRSIWKFQQWLWVLEDKEITDFGFDDYGIALLKRIAKRYNLKVEVQS